MIHYKKFPFKELQGKLPFSEKPLGIPVMNQTHSIQISHLILLKRTMEVLQGCVRLTTTVPHTHIYINIY